MSNRKLAAVLMILLGAGCCGHRVWAEAAIDLVAELGGGEAVTLGGEYHFAERPLWPVENVGVLCGYTYFSEDAVHVLEPAVYVSGVLFKNFTWRVKAGKLLVTTYEYHASGQAWSAGLDVLWNFTSWAYVDLSLPYVTGEQGQAWTPGLGLGVLLPVWKGKKP